MTGEQIRVLAARRAYEFRPDDLRLSLICTVPAQEALKNLFSFAVAQIGTPIPLFGDVPQTVPPGAVFNYGFIVLDEGEVTPIRLLHFEPSRIVIDVAGSSDVLDVVYERVRDLLSGLKSGDGSPAVGEPFRVRNHSEVVFHMGVEPARLLAPEVAETLAALTDLVPSAAVIPAVRVVMQNPTEEYSGSDAASPDRPWAVLEMRVGTKVEHGMFFSAASCDTQTHIRYLASLLTRLSS